MIAMLDADQSGKLGLDEFLQLMADIAKWKAVFILYDVDASGRLSAFELREALNSAGYKLNNRILNAIAHRYSSRDGMITLDDFIMCAVKIKTMMGSFWLQCLAISHIIFLFLFTITRTPDRIVFGTRCGWNERRHFHSRRLDGKNRVLVNRI